MRPVLEYSSSVWDPSGVCLQDELEKVKNQATTFVIGNYNYDTGIMTGILGIPQETEGPEDRDAKFSSVVKTRD